MSAVERNVSVRGLARRVRDRQDRRRVLVEPTAQLRRLAEELYGTPEEGARRLAGYTEDQLELLIDFHRGNAAYQEERLRRLAEAGRPRGARSGGS